MFKLVKDPVSKWPVRWNSVSAAGEFEEQTLMLKLVRVGRADFNRIFTGGEEVSAEQELDDFCRIVKDWEDVVDANGAPVPFSRDGAAALLDLPGFVLAWTIAYVEFWNGRPKEREKNSAKPRAGRPAAAAPTDAAATSASG